MVAAHLKVPVDGPAADLLQEIVGGLEAPGPRERRRGFKPILYGLSGRSDNEPRPMLRATCVFSEPFVVVVTLAMVTMMLMVNVSCDDTA